MGKAEVFRTNSAAVTRDYIAKPRLGREFSFGTSTMLIDFAEYKTVSAVNGPLVILDNVKASPFI